MDKREILQKEFSDKNVEYLKLTSNIQDNSLKISLSEEKWAQTIVYSVIGQYNALLMAEKMSK